jgi:UDP-glucose 4-epimerase
VDGLLARGDEVTVLDDLSTGRLENLDGALEKGAVLREGSITDAATVASVFDEARPEAVYHLAAQIDVRRAVENPAFDATVNVAGTAILLEAARRAGAGRFLLACTGGAIYGDTDTIPTPEDAPRRPLSPYGTSKAAAEDYLALYERLHGLRTLSLRLANVYGPRQDPRGEAGVVAIYCGAAVDGRRAVVYGDGLQTRDFVYVGDVVDAFVAGGRGDAVGHCNIATGRETTVLELAQALGLETVLETARPGEVRRSCLDPTWARELIGWEARTSLEDGLARTLDAAR